MSFITAEVEISNEGVLFGNCFITHDKLVGNLPEGSIIKNEYNKWFNSQVKDKVVICDLGCPGCTCMNNPPCDHCTRGHNQELESR